MLEIKEKIIDSIKKSLADTDFSGLDFVVEKPNDLNHGDYASNVAFILAKKLNTNPKMASQVLSEKIAKNLPDEVDEIEIAGSGFINFKLKPEFFQKNLNHILDLEQDYGKNKNLKGQKIIIEYTDPNPFKQFHIGHLMSNSIGEASARLLEWSGAKISRACYQGDVGLHVAKTLWGMLQNLDNFPKEADSISVKTKFLGEAYVLGSQKYEEDKEIKNAINEINKKVFEFFDEKKNTDVELEEYYLLGKEWSLKHFDEIYQKLGTAFDYFLLESGVTEIGKEMVFKNLGKVFEESEGAIVYRGEQDGLHTRVFINKLGLPTYEAKDLGLAIRKEHLGKFDRSIVITADEQKEYFKVMLAALKKIEPKIVEKTTHITHGMMQFASGKMSSRKGNVITGESLIEETEKMVAEKISDRELSGNKEEIKSAIAVAALKYSILKQSPGKNIIFDPDTAISFEGDSGPYIQYSCVRAKSILAKAKEQKKIPNPKKLPNNWQTEKLEKMLIYFPEIISKATAEMAPQYVATYMTELASEFNSFYGSAQILDNSEEEGYKIALTQATLIVLSNSLRVLGMKVPEAM